MVAVEIDYTRLNKYTHIFGLEFDNIFSYHAGTPDDFKTRKFHRGAGGWSVIPGKERKQFIENIVDLVCECGKIYTFALSFEKLNTTLGSGVELPEGIHGYWIPSALFILSHIQREHCDDKKNKGNCVIVVDDNKGEHANMAELIYQTHPWLDEIAFKASFLSKNRRPKNWERRRFDQIVNTPFAIKSQHASIIQVADLIAFVLRRDLELRLEDEAFPGEQEFFSRLTIKLRPIIKTHANLKKDSEPYKFFRSIQPSSWRFSIK